MIPGTKPKPTKLKLIEGNPGKRPLNMNEPKPKPTIPECPDWLKSDEIAYKEWQRVVPELETLGLLTCLDGAALEGYCKSYSRFVEAEQFMDSKISGVEKKKGTVYKITTKTGSEYLQQLPQVSIAQKYLQIAIRLMAEFGLTPSSRGRMSLPSEGKDDGMEGLLD